MSSEPQVQAFFHARGHAEASGHFILTAVLVAEDRLAAARAVVDRVRAKYATKSDLRAVHLVKKPTHYVRALEELGEAPFTFYAIVVDRTQLPGEARSSDDDFHARLAGMLYRQLFTRHPSLQVTASEEGRAPFMQSFSEFLLRHHASSLFDRPRFHFVPARDEPLVQLADVISGALARTYDGASVGGDETKLLDLVRSRHALQIDEWPVRYRPASGVGLVRAADANDADIARYSIAAAETFIEAKSDAIDEDVRGQLLVLTRLLFEARFADPRSYLPTETLRQALAPVGKANESLHWLRSNVIAPLRDAGVLVASSSRGYKIPLSVADVTDFVLRTDTVVHPMLHRVARAREAVRKVTKGRVDVLADDRFALLRAAVDAAKATD